MSSHVTGQTPIYTTFRSLHLSPLSCHLLRDAELCLGINRLWARPWSIIKTYSLPFLLRIMNLDNDIRRSVSTLRGQASGFGLRSSVVTTCHRRWPPACSALLPLFYITELLFFSPPYCKLYAYIPSFSNFSFACSCYR